MSLLIKNILFQDTIQDIYVEGNIIKQIGPDLHAQSTQVINGKGKALIPGFINAHTHAAMTLFAGLATICH